MAAAAAAAAAVRAQISSLSKKHSRAISNPTAKFSSGHTTKSKADQVSRQGNLRIFFPLDGRKVHSIKTITSFQRKKKKKKRHGRTLRLGLLLDRIVSIG